jgi:transcriptional regulator with XRE-family HTH domain
MIKDRIKELRKSNNLTLKSFAESVGISGTSASLYESGKQNPGKKTLDKICEVYGVTKEWLTGDEVKKSSASVAEKVGKEAAPVVDKGEKKVVPDAEKSGKTVAPATKKAEKAAAPVTVKPEETVAPGAEKVEKAVEAVVAETGKAVHKVSGGKKNKKEVEPVVMIESAAGAQISMEEILKRVNEAVKAKERLAIYVKPEDNKAYYSSESGEGSVDLW